jgi:hypothetical protein
VAASVGVRKLGVRKLGVRKVGVRKLGAVCKVLERGMCGRNKVPNNLFWVSLLRIFGP